jgi:transposase-like protein
MRASKGDAGRDVNDVAASRQFIVEDLMPKAVEAGIPLDALARLLGISRQTLYRWRDGTTRN